MNLSNRLKKIEQKLGVGEQHAYIFVRPEDEGGSITLYGEEGKKYWDSTMEPGAVIIKNGSITLVLPPELVG